MSAFTLDEEAARDWVANLIVTHELADLDGSPVPDALPRITLDWRPREPGQEDAVASLIRHAVRRPGVLVRPENADVTIQFVDDGDDWSYHILLCVGPPAPLTLAGVPNQVRCLGEDAAFGVDAAIGVLREVARTAETLLGQLHAFVDATVRRAGERDAPAAPPRSAPC